MPKSKKPTSSTPDQGAWIEKQRQAIQLVKDGQASAAMEVYEGLERNYPDDPRVMAQLVNAYYNMGDLAKYEWVMRRLVDLEGPRVDSVYGLAGAYHSSGRRALALHTYRDFLNRWPEEKRAADVKAIVTSLEQDLFKQALNLGTSLDLDLFVLADEVRYQIDHKDMVQARAVVKRLLRRKKDFIPGLDLLVQIDATEGRLDQATATAQKMLAIDPANTQSLNSLVRLNFLSGHPEEANRLAEVLKLAPRASGRAWTLIAEGLAFVEDDQGLMALLAEAETAKQPGAPIEDAGFYHLAAVSAWHLGQEDKARELWEEALKKASYFSWAKDNLSESRKPAGERGAIWAFPFEYWLLGPVTEAISAVLKDHTDQATTKPILQRFIDEKHPELVFLAPHLVARGDAQSRDFVARVAALSAHPGLVEPARAMVSAQTGAYAERLAAAELLVEGGVLPPGSMHLWQDGKWVQRLVLAIEVDNSALQNHFTPEVSELAIQASEALAVQDGAAAQAALEKALALDPGDPLLLNNLGLAYELQDETAKAEDLLNGVYRLFPNNFFAAIGMIRLATEKDNIPAAQSLLRDLVKRRRMHVTEFASLCMAEIEVCLADLDRVNASMWLELWERKDPGNTGIPEYRKAIEPSKGKKKK